jgi:hypothetical protein
MAGQPPAGQAGAIRRDDSQGRRGRWATEPLSDLGGDSAPATERTSPARCRSSRRMPARRAGRRSLPVLNAIGASNTISPALIQSASLFSGGACFVRCGPRLRLAAVPVAPATSRSPAAGDRARRSHSPSRSAGPASGSSSRRRHVAANRRDRQGALPGRQSPCRSRCVPRPARTAPWNPEPMQAAEWPAASGGGERHSDRRCNHR